MRKKQNQRPDNPNRISSNGLPWILAAILAIMLSVSVGVNYYLMNLGRRYYDLFNSTRLDPLGLDSFTDGLGSLEPGNSGGIKVVFFGDSRVAEWPLPKMDGFIFINRGINSQTSSQLLLRYDAHIKPLKPDILVIQVCINDLYANPRFEDSHASSVARCKDNIRQILRKAREQDAVVVLTTIFPVGRMAVGDKLFGSGKISFAVEQVNSYIRSLDGQDIVVWDTYSLLADSKGKLPIELSRDELHLNSAGYEKLNQELVLLINHIAK